MQIEGSYHHGALREALLDSALAMLGEGDDLSLRAVARRAGVSHAAPYHHFADRRALIAAIAQQGLASLRGKLEAAAEAHAGDPFEGLLEVGVAYVRFALENRPLFRLIFGAELSDRSGMPELAAAYGAGYEVLTGIVRPLLRASADMEQIRYAALHAWSVVHGLANLLLEEQIAGVCSIEAAEETARQVLRRAVAGGVTAA